MVAYGSSTSTPTPSAAGATVAVPMIPGLVSTQRYFIGRTNFHKGQLLERMAQGRETITTETATASTNKGGLARETAASAWLTVAEHHRAKATKSHGIHQATVPTAAVLTTTKSVPSSTFRKDATQPKWLTYDRQVLRFFGFFLEPLVVETHAAPPTTQHHVRRVVLFFHLSDHSLSVSEPRVANSGLAQGEFLKRSVVLAPRGVPFEPQDFNVGGYVKLHGRTIQLVDCDETTRNYYDQALGQPQGLARKYPDDRSSQLDELDELKQRLKRNAAASAESKREQTRKFHELSQRVLRFYVSWRDEHPLYPEIRAYVLHYYLSDDTVEIVEPKEPKQREGRGHFAVLLSRRRVNHSASGKRLRETDLRCGESVTIAARTFQLEDCDAFTRDWYLEIHGVTQERMELVTSVAPQKAAKWKLFQADSEEQSPNEQGYRANNNRAKNPQFFQNEALENKQLRFRARFHGVVDATAQSRELVLTYYLEDDTLSVFEPRVANSGVIGGRFLERGRYLHANITTNANTNSSPNANANKPQRPKPFRASDLFVGAVIAFASAPHQQLEIIEADRQTLTFCESHADQFPYSNGDLVLATLARCSTTISTAQIRRVFRALDPTPRVGALPVADVRRLLLQLGLATTLNAQQLVTLCRRFEESAGKQDETGGGGGPRPFAYDDFCDALALRLKPTSTVGTTTADAVEKLRLCGPLRRLLREADVLYASVVDASELRLVATAYKVALSSGDVQTIVARFGRQRNGAVDYNALCDRVFDGADEHEDNDDDAEQNATNQFSLRRGDCDDHDDGSVGELGGSDGGDACSPDLIYAATSRLASPRRQARPLPSPRVPALAVHSTLRGSHRGTVSALAAPRLEPKGSASSSPCPSDARVVALLRRVFGDRKYLLRKALRDRDRDKSGFLDEEPFMEALLGVEPRLSDDDTYLLADAFFPTNNSQVEYAKLLESAFRS